MERKSVAAVFVSIALMVGSYSAFAHERGDREHDRDNDGYAVTASSRINLSFPGVLVNFDLSNNRRGFIWVPGYWQYRGYHRGYAWVSGHWEKREKYRRPYARSSQQCYVDSRYGR